VQSLSCFISFLSSLNALEEAFFLQIKGYLFKYGFSSKATNLQNADGPIQCCPAPKAPLTVCLSFYHMQKGLALTFHYRSELRPKL
jgi:hypothetical protein